MLPENAIRDELFGLIEKLPDSELHVVKRHIEFLLSESKDGKPEKYERGTIGALRAAIQSFTPLPPDESGFDLTEFLMEERRRSITDYSNPLTERRSKRRKGRAISAVE